MKPERSPSLLKVFYSLLVVPLLLFCSFLPKISEAAGIKSVQRGTVTFTSGANRMAMTAPDLQAVDPTKTIVWGGIVHGGGRVSGSNPNDSRIGFDLESGTTLALERLGTSPASTPVVEWQAVEFLSGVSVQRGLRSFTTAQTTVNVTLPTPIVDLSKSFVLVSVAPNMTGQGADERWTIRAQLTSSTNLELARLESGSVVDVYWQVVEMQGASVQRGLTTIPSGSTSATAAITPIDPAKSFLIMIPRGGATVDGIEVRYMARGTITDGDTLTFNRFSSSGAVGIAWQVVSMNDGTIVQRGSHDTATTSETIFDQTISQVDLSSAFVLLSSQGGASGAINSLDDVSWTGVLTSQTNLRLQRGASGANSTVNWQVVQFALPASNLAITTQPTNAAAGAAIPGPLTVAVQDSLGNVVTTSTASITVAIGANPDGGALSGTLTRNAVSGVASFNDLSLDKVGNGYTLTVSSTGLTGATSAGFNISPGAAAKLAFTAQPGNANAGSNIPGPPTVTVQDSFNNTVTSSTAAITMALGNNPGGGTLSGTTTKNASGGVASFNDLTINQPGSGYTLAASSTSLTGATSSGFNIIAVVPDLVVSSLSDPPASAVVGSSFSVTDTSANNGNGLAGASTTSYRLSTDNVITTSDTLLSGNRSVPSLAAGANSSGNVTVTIPANLTPGTYFLGACADNANTVAESNETNNCTASATSVAVSAPPNISSLSPTSGSVGTSVTIAGSNFGAIQGTSTVTFNGTVAAPASWSANNIVVPVPAAATTGPVVVTVDGVASNGVAFTVKPPIGYIYDALGRLRAVIDPSSDTAVYNYDAVGNLLSIGRQSSSTVAVIEFSPKSGPVGTTVTIQGTGFSATASENTVAFNGASATITSATTTQLVASVPAGATTGPIGVTTLTGSSTSSTNFLVTSGGSQGAPTITSFTPPIGTPGTVLTITGTNFDLTPANNKVTVNSTLTTNSSATATTIVSKVPNAGSGRISLSTPYGKTTSSADVFIPPSPYTAADVEFTDRMPLDGTKTATFTTANKIGLVVFDATAGQRVGFNTNGQCFGFGIYKPNGASLIQYASLCSGFVEPVNLPTSGTYTILVKAGANTGSNTFTLIGATDVTGTIIAGGPPVTIDITKPGQNASLTFAGAAGQQVSVETTGSTINLSYVWLLTPDGTNLFTPPTLVGSGSGFVDSHTLPITGTYTIRIDPFTIYTGTMTVTLHDVTDIVGSITPGGPPVTVSITVPGQNATLTFPGSAGQRVSLLVNSSTVPGGFCVNGPIRILKPDGATLVSTSICGNAFTDSVILPMAGNYTVLVDPSGNGIGGITMTLYDVPADVTGSIIPNGPPVTVGTTTPGQNARLTFDGTAGQKVSLSVTNSTISLSFVSIQKPDGTNLSQGTTVTSAGFVDTLTLPVAGTYTIFVDPLASYTGSMTLTLYDVSDIVGTITPGGPPVTVNITVPGQNARLTFASSAGQRVNLLVNSSTFPGSCVSGPLRIVKPDGVTLVSTSVCAGIFTDAVTLPMVGNYIVLVDPSWNSTGSITLTLYDVPPDVTGSITPNGPPVTITTTTPGQNARVTFDGTAGQRVSLRMTNSTINLSFVSIQKPDGTNLSQGTTVTSAGFVDTLTLPTTGAYTIFVDPANMYTGNITLTLYDVTDIVGSITPGGSPVTVNITVAGQNARLSFAGNTGQRVSLLVNSSTFPGSCVNGPLRILKPDGATLVSTSLCAGAFTDAVTLPMTGTYTVFVDPSGTTTGDITLTLYDVPPDVTGPIVPDGPAVTITTTTPGQNARMTFDGTAGQRVSVQMTNVTTNISFVSVLKPDGTNLVSPTFVNTFGGLIDTPILPVTGTYTILVDPHTTYTGSMTLTLYSFTDISGTLTIGGSPITVTFTTPGQQANLTFNGTAGQQVTVRMTNNTINTYGGVTVSLRKADNTILAISGSIGASFNLSTVSLPATATYTVLIDPFGANTGSISVTVTSP
jgi:YD repeat-containing protein